MLLTDILLGAMSVGGAAAGVSALVLYRKNGNGHAPQPAPVPVIAPPEPPVLHVRRREPVVIAGLEELPAKIEQGLAPVFEGAIQRMANLVQLQIETLKPQQEMLSAQEWDERFESIAENLHEPISPITAVATLDPEMVAKLERISDRLDAIISSIPEPAERQSLTAQIARGLAELPDRLARQVSGLLGGSGGGGAASPPPLRRDPPPNLFAIPPGAQPVTPQVPASYVGGAVYATAGQVANLLLLIQYQLSPNCPGTSAEFSISAEDGPVFVGAASALGGPLSATNYAYQLTPGGPPRIYRSSFPGNNTPIGELQVLSPGGGYLHVEVQS